MNIKKTFYLGILSLFISSALSNLFATSFSLNPLYTDHMVLQRNVRNHVWGTADAGAVVRVVIDAKEYQTKALADGTWRLTIEPLSTKNNPYTMIVTCNEKEILLTDILAGDVYLLGGQSNMELGLSQVSNADWEIQNSFQTNIRMYRVERNTSLAPIDSVSGKWVLSSPESTPQFSAIGYFFAREIEKHQKVPIGLIGSYWGATGAQLWIPYETLDSNPLFSNYKSQIKDQIIHSTNVTIDKRSSFEQLWENWKANIKSVYTNRIGEREGWALSSYNDSEWKIVSLPSSLEQNLGDINGVVWFRKKIILPTELIGSDLTIALGAIDDYDHTWVNGQIVGTTFDELPDSWSIPRVYKIPEELTKCGFVEIAVRLIDVDGPGGFASLPSEMIISKTESTTHKINIAGDWKCQIELKFVPEKGPSRPNLSGGELAPTVLYNAMIHPLRYFSIRSVLWYQGEANVENAEEYRALFPALINSWRKTFNNEKLGFYYVQLANFMKQKENPEESQWAMLRESQLSGQSLPKTGVVVAIDIGDEKDIHPKNKKEVGKRLSLVARALEYGENVAYRGPTLNRQIIKGSKIILEFDFVDGGFVVDGEKLKGFAIAGSDGKYVWANAVISGNSVLVSHPTVQKPVSVRYGWGDNPGCNLYNGSGLPAVPFRTDGIENNKYIK